MKKQTKEVTKALATVNQETGLALPDMSNMVQQINDDMRGAEVGLFKTIRAGIGLTAIKAMNEWGAWEQRMMELFPNKSARTLQIYMQRAKPFLADTMLTAEQAWADLSKMDLDQAVGLVLAANTPKQLGAGEPEKPAGKKGKKASGDSDKPGASVSKSIAEQLVDFVQKQKKEKDKTPPKPLTKAEKIKAATDNAERVRHMVSDWIDDADYTLIPLADLELAKSDLMSAAGKLGDEIKSREAKQKI